MKLSQLHIKTILRIALVVCSGVIIVISAITIGIVERNKDFTDIRSTNEFQSLQQLKDLVTNTLATAVWLIVFNVIVFLWEAVYAILPVITPHFSFLQRYSIIMLIIDAVFSCVAVVCSLASMIACIVYADSWGEPPEACDQYGRFYKDLDCDDVHLEGTYGSLALLCVIQITSLLLLGVMSGLSGFPKTLLFLQRLGATSRSRIDGHEPAPM